MNLYNFMCFTLFICLLTHFTVQFCWATLYSRSHDTYDIDSAGYILSFYLTLPYNIRVGFKKIIILSGLNVTQVQNDEEKFGSLAEQNVTTS